MKRRTFLLLSVIGFITKGFASDKKADEFKVLKAVLEHLFPQTPKYSGASQFGAFEFIMFISKHSSFDKSDFEFLVEGADELSSRYENFLNYSKKEKEKVLREYEQTRYGGNWLSFLMYYGIEAMLGDPIYKGNKDMRGWKNIAHTTPIPTAKTPFGKMK